MHESLAKTLQLARTWISVCHLCKIRIHTRVPAAESFDSMARIKITDIITLTSRTNKRTRSAGNASFIKFLPLRCVKYIVQAFGQAFSAEIVHTQICKRQFRKNCTDIFFLRFQCFFIFCRRLFENTSQKFCQGLPFLCFRFPI